MREKILDLMKNEGLKPSQLAEMLGINPAGISHILAGRNKPGFDLLRKILLRFPQINPDWLMLDTGPMYRDAVPGTIAAPQPVDSLSRNQNLFDSESELPEIKEKSNNIRKPGDLSISRMSAGGTSVADGPKAQIPERNASGARVTRVVIFYDDRTFESFSPSER